MLVTNWAYHNSLEAGQAENPAGEKTATKCCAGDSKAGGCHKAECSRTDRCCSKGKCCAKGKCCPSDGEKRCCQKGEAAKGCQKQSKGGCCSKIAATAKRSKGQLRASASKKASKDPAAQWAKAVARLKKIGYTDEDIAYLPRGAVLASAGAKNVVAYADLKPGEVVVDLGCGGGIDCLLAARLVGPKGKVIGVDMSEKALATARKNLKELGLKNVEFRRGRLEKLPLPDASVDVAISNCVGIVMRGDAAVLSEAARVLKPGGRLVTTGRLRDEYRAKLKAAGFTTVEQPTKGMIVAKKPK
ncbi:MAG: methyltransferase domain-containing protein [Planctomycetes bacterium]|nr:methyltransferase domain-containing protein [Planctomycetota bacterium]